ncbi:hypothetical protein CMUS01_10095 [Colletotrichum musicola]|uniref:DUF7888 domain-containing protein n=1 Tax=Colletotrichum musicola TaxID=2175873 RepID=A0A8H6N9M3_9PEZI|nr:hypothetical protein CMUS01_10095 [Colletotrichum musicola]
MPHVLPSDPNAGPAFGLTTTVTVKTDNATAQITVPANLPAKEPAGGLGSKADAASAVADVLSKVVKLVQGLVDDDFWRRQAFTQNTVAQVRQRTKNNVIMSKVGYDFKGTFIDRTSTKYKVKVSADVSFDVIQFKTGSFTLKGDGGFQNWAYVVDGTCTTNGRNVDCK